MTTLFKSDAVSRARQFLSMAKECTVDQRDKYEALLEAAIVFGRAALHRLQTVFGKQAGWKPWFDAFWEDPSVQFFKDERDHVLKQGPAKVGQVIRMGVRTERAEEHYHFESPNTPATATVERHLDRIEQIVAQAYEKFGAEKK